MERTPGKDIMLIDGMKIETAGRYVALRKEIDVKLNEIESLGKIIAALCLEDVNIDRYYLMPVGAIIAQKANEIEERLDQFSVSDYLELDLEKQSRLG